MMNVRFALTAWLIAATSSLVHATVAPSQPFACAFPAEALKYSVITKGDARIGAHSMYWGLAIGGTLTDTTPNESGTVDKTRSIVKTLATDNKFNFNGGLDLGVNLPTGLFEHFEWLARNVVNSESGLKKVVSVNKGGTYNLFHFRGSDAQAEDNGNTVVFFNTTEDIFISGENARSFGPTIIAPFSKVTVFGNAGFVDGLIVAKTLDTKDNDGQLQLHGDTFMGILTCPCINAGSPVSPVAPVSAPVPVKAPVPVTAPVPVPVPVIAPVPVAVPVTVAVPVSQPTSGYCNWNNCDGNVQGDTYCKVNQAQCLSCGGTVKWCPRSAPVPTPVPPPTTGGYCSWSTCGDGIVQDNPWCHASSERCTVNCNGKWCGSVPVATPVKPPSKAPTKAPTRRPSKFPTKSPTKSPTKVPTKAPTKRPSKSPTKAPIKCTKAPTRRPTRAPTRGPTRAPSRRPSRGPTRVPTQAPTRRPTSAPTSAPTKHPTLAPTRVPTRAPTKRPSRSPTRVPTRAPTKVPSRRPTRAPTRVPTRAPTRRPTHLPTKAPIRGTAKPVPPTKFPTKAPTKRPTKAPSRPPTNTPSKSPTNAPSKIPTKAPTKTPSKQPSKTPTKTPTKSPTKSPTKNPTKSPSKIPTKRPTKSPTKAPTKAPIKAPSKQPTKAPTKRPTKLPTKAPSKRPTVSPTKSPTKSPTLSPTTLACLPKIEINNLVVFGSDPEKCETPEAVEYLESCPGAIVTYCFEVINTGCTHLDSVTIVNPMLNFTSNGIGKLSASESVIVSYTTKITGPLKNDATVTGNPVLADGKDIPHSADVTDSDPSSVGVREYSPSITVDNKLYLGNDGGASCGSKAVEKVTDVHGSQVFHCFRVTNTGNTYLKNVALTNTDLLFSDSSIGLLAPKESVMVPHKTTIMSNLTNNVVVTAKPVMLNGMAILCAANVIATDPSEVAVKTINGDEKESPKNSTGSCIEDKWKRISKDALKCTTKHVYLESIKSTKRLTCKPGEIVSVTVDSTMVIEGQRNDLGWYVAVDGGSALTGTCVVNGLQSRYSYVVTDGISNKQSVRPVWAKEQGGDGDECGDVEMDYTKGLLNTPVLVNMTLPCTDENDNGVLDVALCFTWRGDTSNKDECKLNENVPGSDCSCYCTRYDIPNVEIETPNKPCE